MTEPECTCNVCTRCRVYTTYALVFALALAVVMTAGAVLERLGL